MGVEVSFAGLASAHEMTLERLFLNKHKLRSEHQQKYRKCWIKRPILNLMQELLFAEIISSHEQIFCDVARSFF